MRGPARRAAHERLAAWATAWRIARRDLRGGLTGFLVFVSCLALGVGCITAVGIGDASVVETIRRDGRVLLGGDAVLSTVNLPLPEEDLVALRPPGAELARSVHTHSFAVAGDGRRAPVSLRGVDASWPLYGDVALDPPLDIKTALADGGAVAEPLLLARLGVGVGDRLRIGSREVEIRAVLLREPDRAGGLFAVGPRLLVALDTLAAADILLPGALARYRYALKLPPGLDPDAFAASLERSHPEARWRVRTASDVEPRIRRFTDRLASYLALAALAVLLVGSLGIALAVAGYLDGKRRAIAALKCLGATAGDVTRAYALQMALFASLGITVGLALGSVAPALLLALFADALPWRLSFTLSPKALLIAAAIGSATVGACTVLPLARARRVPPAYLLRALVERRAGVGGGAWLELGGFLAALAALAVFAVPRPIIGVVFVALLPPVLLALWGLALVVRLAAARLARRMSHVRWRLALAALARPGSPTAGVVLALGAGLAVLVTVVTVEARFRDEIATQLPERTAALFLIDIQPDQLPALQALVRDTAGAELLQAVPVVRARVVRIAGRPVSEAGVAEDIRWTVEGDRALTYRRDLLPEDRLVAGEWWPPDYAGPPLVSIEERVARGYGVGLGDTIHFNVLGRVIEARIANIREEIDWSRGRIDFVFVLSPGLLEAAPQSWIAALDLPPVSEARFIDALGGQLPNVTPIPMREVVARVSEVIAKIGFALSVVAALAVAGGLLVLAGAIVASRRRHQYETVIMKTLGATRADLLRLFLAEYAVLGAVCALVGVAIGLPGAWLVMRLLARLDFAVYPLPVLAVLGVGVLLVLLAGAVATLRLLGVPPARILAARS